MIFFLLLISLIYSSLAEKSTFPNIGYLGRGYHIIYANPSNTMSGTDPGFKMEVFSFKYKDDLLTPDQRFKIPIGTEVHDEEFCEIDFSSTEIKKGSEYTSTVGRHVKLDPGYSVVKFTASYDYKNVAKSTVDLDNVFTMSEAVCTKYEAAIKPFDPPELTSDFKNGVKLLPDKKLDSKGKKVLRKFVKTFGTHVAMEVTMGARYGQMAEVGTDSWEEYKENTKTWESTLALSAKVSFGGHLGSSDEKKAVENFKKLTKTEKIISLGSKPPADGGAKAWAQEVINEPMPVKYGLTRIDEFLTTDYFPSDNISEKLLADKQKILAKFLDEVCEDMIAQKQLDTCHPKDPTPKGSKSCRMCQSCRSGGAFSVEVGKHLIKNEKGLYDDFSVWDMFGPSCNGKYERQLMKDWSLCCAENPPCYLCKTCGRDYPYEMGMHWKWSGSYYFDVYNVKQEECTGALARFESDWRLCCKAQSQTACRLCERCGKDMEEVGRRHVVPYDKSSETSYGPIKVFAPGSCDRDGKYDISDPKIYRSGYWMDYDVKLCCPKQ